MRYYFAPLEGIAGYRYRNAHHQFFPGMDRYYSPFVVTRDGGIMKQKELRDILPENNRGLDLVPQILTNIPENFLQASGQMKELGYEEVNLNLGCPSGTVTGKGRGAGFLRPERRIQLQKFLDEIFTHAEVKISVKTRIGWDDPEDFREILELLNTYPIQELTVHPRTRQEFYRGRVHRDIFAYAYEHSSNPLCYNGDICTVEDYDQLLQDFPDLGAVMIGRGLIADPTLVSRLQGYEVTKGQVWEFYQTIFRTYQDALSGDTPLLHKMKELWIFMAQSFTDSEKYLKKIKKTKSLTEYQTTVQRLFEEQELVFLK
ncbi:MAG: tRNA-dihydrouridine synthase family protein [Eubacteriales bacterium]|nr:tRNA-dihydrouridine synthase family protein [Eubacteriales bacterium]